MNTHEEVAGTNTTPKAGQNKTCKASWYAKIKQDPDAIQKFKDHYPNWDLTYSVTDILKEIYSANISRWI